MKNFIVNLCLLVSILIIVEADPRCNNGKTHFPHEWDCSKFYQCENQENIALHSCGAGLHFNAKISACDWPMNAKCNLNSSLPTNSSDHEQENLIYTCPIYNDPRNPIHLPYQHDCTKFYKCYNGEKVLIDCPSGLFWNSDAKNCDWPENAKCYREHETKKNQKITTENCSINAAAIFPTYLPHDTDCTKFYKCFFNSCPPGFHWNINKNYCARADGSECNLKPTQTTTPSNEKPTTVLPTSPTTTSTGKPTTHPTKTTTMKQEAYPKECPLNEDSRHPTHLPHPTDCTKYYKWN